MITDEQGREWLLQKLYDDGWRYYVRNIGGVAFLTTKKPVMEGNILEITSGEKIKHADAIRNIMPEINKCVVLDIAEELGIVDWSKVPVDTKILVSCDECNWFKKYFAKVQMAKSMLGIMVLHHGVLAIRNIVLLGGDMQN